ncbi:glycosyltransferase [Stratiformator vulcanicus]|uniref:Glycosyltransferase EpsD n=1 Tax=Stratiformator vulcanicus TaxID=2527980 RepID=A0A517R234_9PLAN|nr:glycosyltransferase [Stratiformator vulcanicus]QDT37914.1 Putative glycosyltransferase EpsD [Stratiformator vulcanicus]
MKRILLITPTLDASGAEKQFTELACGLSDRDFDVHVVALSRGGPYASRLQEHGIPLTVLNKRLKFDPSAWYRLRSTIRKLNPNLIHTWMFTANSYGRMAVASGSDRPKVVVSERCVDSWKAGWQHFVDRRLMDRTDLLIANSKSVAQFYEQRGFPSERTRVVRNWVDVSPVATERRSEIRESLGLNPDDRVVGFVGRLAKQKRVGDLVWALQLGKQLTENLKFLIIGDGPERNRLEELAVNYSCEDLIHFTGHREDARSLLPAFDVFWFASAFEGQSNSLMEAMATGLPAIASDIPPNRELIDNGVDGYLVPLGDSVAFAQFMARLFDDPGMAEQIGAAAKQKMQEQFTRERMINAYVDIYMELLDS